MDFSFGTIFLLAIAVIISVLLGALIGPTIAHWISNKFASSLFSSEEKFEKEQAIYSIPRALVQRGEYQEAVKEYEKILLDEEKDELALLELAQLYEEKLKDYSQALSCYDKLEHVTDDERTLIFIFNRRSDLYLQQKNYEAAIGELQKIKDRFPKSKDSKWAEERMKNLSRIKDKA